MELPSREGGPIRHAPRALAALLAALLASFAGARAGAAFAAEAPATAPLEAGESARVKAVIDGDTLELEDGRVVRLMGIMAAKPPLDAEAGRRWPLAERAGAALRELALGQEVRLVYAGRKSDRYGRLLAQLYRADGLWLEGELLAQGLARVLTHKDNRALASAMLEREREARDKRRGLWAARSFAVLVPEEARRHLDSFELVEGKIDEVNRRGSHEFLRMGTDARSGFTAVLLPESKRLFAAAGIEPASLAGRRVRVRGFIRWWNGPIIEVSHPEQIELVEP
ncbi:MAG TPA: thermonuclease family protein [Alphaproteobacteria bacterium]|nr:thermonuclease family protein [Alphaproteobacteria bacterium]